MGEVVKKITGLGIKIMVFCFFSLGAFFVKGQVANKFLSMPIEWYESEEAAGMAENVRLYQRNVGGWAKGNNYIRAYSKEEKETISKLKKRRDSTFDNDATHTELTFLAKVYSATNNKSYKDAFKMGMDFIFEAQYDNGGWPQYYPESHIIWSQANSRWNPEGIEYFI